MGRCLCLWGQLGLGSLVFTHVGFSSGWEACEEDHCFPLTTGTQILSLGGAQDRVCLDVGSSSSRDYQAKFVSPCLSKNDMYPVTGNQITIPSFKRLLTILVKYEMRT